MSHGDGPNLSSKVSIASISQAHLDNACLKWIAKIARALKAHDGTVIDLQDQFVLRIVVAEAKRTQSEEVRQLYMRLKTALRNHINSEGFQKNELNTVPLDEWRASRFIGD